VRAVLVGEGPQRAVIEGQIKELGLGANLTLVGQKTRAEVLELMRQSKVFVHSSEMEGTGLVLVEALGQGMHLVTTPVGVGEQLPMEAGSDKTAVSQHTFGLYEAALRFLKAPVDWNAREPFPMQGMVASHLQLYGWGS
jgi:glycosyltransferase involved in cell wall biosynthesis